MRLAYLKLLAVLVSLVWNEVCAVLFHDRNFHAGARPRLQNKSNETTTKQHKSNKKEKEVVCVDGVCHVRGGSIEDYDDEFYDDEEEELPPLPKKRPSRPPHSSSSRRGPPPRRPPPSRRGPPPRRRQSYSKQPSLLNSAAGLAKKTASLTTNAAVGTIKGSGKAAFYLVSPKHVTRREVWGVWRLDQQVNSDSENPISCAANVEFTPRGEVVVKYKDEVYETTYLFRERSWPQSCTIEFEARAFQGPHDQYPVLMRYKGFFRRKMADSSVVKIVGNIYEVPRKGLWRKGRTGRKIGTFVARRRMTKRETRRQDEVEDEFDDDEYEFEEDWDEEEDIEEDEEDFEEDEYDEYDD